MEGCRTEGGRGGEFGEEGGCAVRVVAAAGDRHCCLFDGDLLLLLGSLLLLNLFESVKSEL